MKYLSVFDKNKLLILDTLYKCHKDVCGCDLVNDLNLTKNLISYHIKILKNLGLITDIRCGNRKNYKLASDTIDDVEKILKAVHLI